MVKNTEKFSDYFLELQTQTGWGRMLSSFARFCNPQPGQLVLDIGCGPGLLPALFAETGATAFGSDIDPDMFAKVLHPDLVLADIWLMPFAKYRFDMITASNLIYLLDEPMDALKGLIPLLKLGGQICMLNPSEKMTFEAAENLANDSGLRGVARDTLLGYGKRAEEYFRWSEEDLMQIFSELGLELKETNFKMGSGLVRFSKGVLHK